MSNALIETYLHHPAVIARAHAVAVATAAHESDIAAAEAIDDARVRAIYAAECETRADRYARAAQIAKAGQDLRAFKVARGRRLDRVTRQADDALEAAMARDRAATA
jgi:hypothetical protein